MEYNSYYPAQPGHPPPSVTNQQHGGPQMHQQPPPGSQLMHAPMPPQNIRQNMPSGASNHHQQLQQMQQQQHLGHHPQQMASQQQQHPNYHQIQQPHPHGPPVTHSGSPHPQHHNHQPALTGPSPQQQAIQAQQHHMHPQSPHHHGGPTMHMQQSQQQPPQQLNPMVRPPLGPSVMNHPQSGLQQPAHHNQNFFSGGPIPQSNLHYYPQQNQHPHHQPHPQHHHQHHHQPPIMPPLTSHHPHIHQGVGRSSPYYPGILQTEFRVIELNRRLQSRPISRHPPTPLPTNFDESVWWDRFTSEFFEDDATLTMNIRDEKPQEYTIGRTLIPKFFRTYFEGGATDLSISLRNPREACTNPHSITLNCDQAFLITNNIFRNPAIPANQPVVVHTEGHLILDFVSNNYDTLSIKSWKFYTRGFREYIDRSMTAMGFNPQFLAESLTRQGLPKSSTTYLKMCMIMEPMQDLMFAHKQTKMDPRSCLRKLLMDRYKFSSGEDNRVPTNKRNRKRKSSAALAITGTTTTNKKSKSNVNNPVGNNSGLSNNIMMSPAGTPSFPLASQDVMVVGEPSMMGGDFGDDNERMITRLENTQYDPSASTPSNTDELDSLNTSIGNDNGICNSNNMNPTMDNHNPSPSLLQQRQHQQLQQQPENDLTEQIKVEQLNMQEQIREDNTQDPMNQADLVEHNDELLHHHHLQQQEHESHPEQQQHEHHQEQHQEQQQEHQQPQQQLNDDSSLILQQNDQNQEEEVRHEDDKQDQAHEEVKTENLLPEIADNTEMTVGPNSIDRLENHTSSIQPMNDESNSDSQLPCSTAPPTSTMEQKQPVDNGVA